jgi:hypothetical protein
LVGLVLQEIPCKNTAKIVIAINTAAAILICATNTAKIVTEMNTVGSFD